MLLKGLVHYAVAEAGSQAVGQRLLCDLLPKQQLPLPTV
jgi:hypothetical protein